MRGYNDPLTQLVKPVHWCAVFNIIHLLFCKLSVSVSRGSSQGNFRRRFFHFPLSFLFLLFCFAPPTIHSLLDTKLCLTCHLQHIWRWNWWWWWHPGTSFTMYFISKQKENPLRWEPRLYNVRKHVVIETEPVSSWEGCSIYSSMQLSRELLSCERAEYEHITTIRPRRSTGRLFFLVAEGTQSSLFVVRWLLNCSLQYNTRIFFIIIIFTFLLLL